MRQTKANTITVQYLTVLNGGMVNLVAVHSIIFLPGLHAQSGSYLHAWTTETDHCGIIPPPVLTASFDKSEISVTEEVSSFDSDQFFKVYPNLTTGIFTLEQTGQDDTEMAIVEIYSMLGEKLLHTELPTVSHYQFNLQERQSGIYLIRLTQGENVGLAKVIKQ